VNGVTEYRLIYAGQLSPIAKVDASGNTIETYIFGLGVNSPDYILKDGTKYRVIKDHLGSIRMIVNSSTGEVVKTLRYSEFGEITQETGTFNTIFGFAGGIRDTDTELTKFGARWYDPETGRWIEKEPLGFNGSDNFYSYCDGDPVNYVDKDGLEVDAIYDRESGKLTVIDLDTGNYIEVDAESGGKPWGDPIPYGEYDILQGPDNFRLDPIDDSRYNDKFDDAEGRNEFRLHKPGNTTGCIAVKESDSWDKLKDLILNTSTKMVNDNKKYPPWRFWVKSNQKIKRFGKITVQ
jgi:RHS repeat-associated protein